MDKVKNTTCHGVHEKYNKSCKKASCKYWFNCKENLNCVLIAARTGPMTLQEIGDRFNVTRMRVCQIEKTIFKKLHHEIDKIQLPVYTPEQD